MRREESVRVSVKDAARGEGWAVRELARVQGSLQFVERSHGEILAALHQVSNSMCFHPFSNLPTPSLS